MAAKDYRFLSLLMLSALINYVAADKSLISLTCNNTTYPDICISTLESDPRSFTANFTGLSKIAIELTAARVAEGVSYLYNLYQQARDYATWSQFRTCHDYYNMSLSDIKGIGLPSFDLHKYDKAYETIQSAYGAASGCNKFGREQATKLNTFVLKFTNVTAILLHRLF